MGKNLIFSLLFPYVSEFFGFYTGNTNCDTINVTSGVPSLPVPAGAASLGALRYGPEVLLSSDNKSEDKMKPGVSE